MKLRLLCFLASLLFSSVGFAQGTKTITGTIVDATQMPLPGAQLKVVDKEIFAVTDFDGNFTLENVEVGDVVQVTFLGFKSQDLTIGEADNYVITLEEDAAQLEEVVVVGYGTQKKADLTGALPLFLRRI